MISRPIALFSAAIGLHLGLGCSLDLPAEDPEIIPPTGKAIGIVNPESRHQRYRGAEFAEAKRFFQWWFFAIKDLNSGRYFTITYMVGESKTVSAATNAKVNFSWTEEAKDTAFHVVETLPRSRFTVKNHFDVAIDSDLAASGAEHGIAVIDDDTYRIRGKLGQAGVKAHGRHQGKSVNQKTIAAIEWDLTIHRIYGWYGQKSLEPVIKATNGIGWNTFAHSAEVEGTIKVGDETIVVKRNTGWRAYGDTNWGVELPHGRPGEKQIDYPWSWYSVGVARDDRAKELSIIAGAGRMHLEGTGITGAKFANLRLNRGFNLEAAGVEFAQKFFTTNDHKVVRFQVDRDTWTTYTDSSGAALVPLHQKVTLETKSYVVELDFHSKLKQYNRFLMPHGSYTFSNFEAFGVDVHTVVRYPHQQEPVFDFWSDDGGLEYGYVTSGPK